MPTDPLTITGLVIPGALALILLIVAHRPWRKSPDVLGGPAWPAAVAVPVGYIIAHWILVSPPNFNVGQFNAFDVNDRIFLVALAALAVSMLSIFKWAASVWVRLALMLPTTAFASWAVVGTVHADYLGGADRWIWLVGGGLLMLALFAAMDWRLAESRGRLGVVHALLIGSATVPLIGFVAHISVFSLGAIALNGMIVSGLIVMLLLALRGRPFTMSRGAAPTLALVWGSYWIAGSDAIQGRMGVEVTALLGAAAIAPWVVWLVHRAYEKRRVLGDAVSVLLSVAALGVVAWLVWGDVSEALEELEGGSGGDAEYDMYDDFGG